MANYIIIPKGSITEDQNAMTFPVNYTTNAGLAKLLASIEVQVRNVVRVTALEFKDGQIKNVPDGYVQAPYKIPTMTQKNIIAGDDTLTVLQWIDEFIVGSASDYLSDNFAVTMNITDYNIQGSVVPSFPVGREMLVSINKNPATEVALSNISDYAFNAANVEALAGLDFKVGYYNQTLSAYDLGRGVSIAGGWNQLRTQNKQSLVLALNEIYQLAYAGGAGVAGGDLAGNYPNPVVRGNAITGDKIANNTIGILNMQNNSIGESQIVDDSVSSNKIRNGSVISSKLEDGSVGKGKVAIYSIEENRLANNCVSTRTIQGGAVTSDKIASGNVVEGKLSVNAVNTSNIKNGNVTNEKMAANSIANANIVDGTIGLEKRNTDFMTVTNTGFVSFFLRRMISSSEATYFIVGSNVLNIGSFIIKLYAADAADRWDIEFTTAQQSRFRGIGGAVVCRTMATNQDVLVMCGGINNAGLIPNKLIGVQCYGADHSTISGVYLTLYFTIK